jgi:acetyl esterase/lipase
MNGPSLRRCAVVALSTLILSGVAFVPRNAMAASADVQTDVPYGAAAGQTLLMDVYTQPGSDQRPAIVLIHPGGFVGGSKSDPDISKVASFYAEHGYVVFNINYRSARDGFPYPAQVQDVMQAVRFVRTNASQYGIDPSRIATFGASAGATLAASVGLEGTGAWNEGSRVAAVVSWSGALDLVSVATQNMNALEGLYTYVTGKPGKKTNRQGGIDVGAIEPLLQKASPINFVDHSDPPMFIANSVQEFMPLNQAQAMANKLKAAGVANQVFSPAKGHALAYTDQALQPTLAFLNKYVAESSPLPNPSVTASPSPSPGRNHAGGGKPSTSAPLLIGVTAGIIALLALVGLLVWWRRRTEHG